MWLSPVTGAGQAERRTIPVHVAFRLRCHHCNGSLRWGKRGEVFRAVCWTCSRQQSAEQLLEAAQALQRSAANQAEPVEAPAPEKEAPSPPEWVSRAMGRYTVLLAEADEKRCDSDRLWAEAVAKEQEARRIRRELRGAGFELLPPVARPLKRKATEVVDN
jgi:hypothetical protein